MYPRAILKVCRSGSLAQPLLCLPFVESNPGLGDSALLVSLGKLPVDAWLWPSLASEASAHALYPGIPAAVSPLPWKGLRQDED